MAGGIRQLRPCCVRYWEKVLRICVCLCVGDSTYAEWDVGRSRDASTSGPGPCPLVERCYQGGANRCNLKRARRSVDGRFVMCGADDAR